MSSDPLGFHAWIISRGKLISSEFMVVAEVLDFDYTWNMSRSTENRDNPQEPCPLPVFSLDLLDSAKRDYDREGRKLPGTLYQQLNNMNNSGLMSSVRPINLLYYSVATDQMSLWRVWEEARPVIEQIIELVVGITFDLLRRQADRNRLAGTVNPRQQVLESVNNDLFARIKKQDPDLKKFLKESGKLILAENPGLMKAVLDVFFGFYGNTISHLDDMGREDAVEGMTEIAKITISLTYGLMRQAALEGGPEWHE